MRKIILAVGFLPTSLFTGCAARTVRTPVPGANALAPAPGTYIDLEPGWRVRAVTPILKSGKYLLESGAKIDGKTVTIDTGGDFLGYEIAYYAVQARRGGGVRIGFTTAEATRNSVTSSQPKSIAPLFQLPRSARYVRLIYLIRVSQVDHDMAVVAARDIGRLNALTLRVQANPGQACANGPDGRDDFCSWVPAGIAVQPQVERSLGGVPTWGPAR